MKRTQRKILPGLKDLKNNPRTRIYMENADKYLESIGYTEHGFRHAKIVAERARRILEKLNYPERTCELAEIAGFYHDIGNLLGRKNHGISTALMLEKLMDECNFPPEETVQVMRAVANHEEEEADITNEITSGLVIADKSDVHRSRVRNPNLITFDIHDRVNFAASESKLEISNGEHTISLILTIDTKISKVMEYFEIFLSRMILCRKAAEFLNCKFSLIINDMKLL
jgi:metal-dependent HD superfamily phosphatase/phosphodiesterase